MRKKKHLASNLRPLLTKKTLVCKCAIDIRLFSILIYEKRRQKIKPSKPLDIANLTFIYVTIMHMHNVGQQSHFMRLQIS